ncbi:hypothetical protein KSP40_PGU005348 [Platanthera guangdongensis]|uniref:Glycosyl transferase CAP10 domain-containing protein n=1 Tax=Platanthera guangdongensis TaxID=2320717 RepID=A0ABR2MC11_9ASPA
MRIGAQAVEEVASRTPTVAGHNLNATPWHPFHTDDRLRRIDSSASRRILRCSYLSCSVGRFPAFQSFSSPSQYSSSPRPTCPDFFRSIRRDLEPWRLSGISLASLADARKYAAMRVVILAGNRLYLDLYYSCVQSRAMFTIWGLLQLLRRYPGMVPDVDLMFDCMDRPAIYRPEYGDLTVSGQAPPPPLFRYCTTKEHFDIPFPDWSFWGCGLPVSAVSQFRPRSPRHRGLIRKYLLRTRAPPWR